MSNSSNSTTLGFTGDISFSAFFKNGYKNDNLLSDEILDFFKGNDANIINQESPITQCRITKKSRLAHRSDVEVIPYITKKIPNTVFSLANNHMLDYGRIGVVDTVENLEKAGCTFIGAGRNLEESSKFIVVGDEIKIGIIAIQYKRFKPSGRKWAAPFYEGNMGRLRNQIARMKEEAGVDWTVVVYHGGEEFLFAPLPFNRKLLHSIVDMGADAVVAHHPHVVQGYEYYKGHPIFYSLGNFIFDTTYQRAQEGTTQGMLLKLHFTKDEIKFENLPVSINRENHTVGVGDANPYFTDLNKINYNALWTYQCVRKKEALARATELRISEKEKMSELSDNERVRIEQIKMKYIIKQAQDEEANEKAELSDIGNENLADVAASDDSGVSDIAAPTAPSSKSRIRLAKKKVRKALGALKNKKKRTYRRGRFLYKLFYKNKSTGINA